MKVLLHVCFSSLLAAKHQGNQNPASVYGWIILLTRMDYNTNTTVGQIRAC